MSTDPYAPGRVRERQPARRVAPPTPDVTRLRRIGATESEIARAIHRWQTELSEEDRLAVMDGMAAVSDDELRAQIREDRNAGDVAEVVEGKADDVLAWVDGDQAKAAEAIVAENARPRPRSTLLRKLEAVVNG